MTSSPLPEVMLESDISVSPPVHSHQSGSHPPAGRAGCTTRDLPLGSIDRRGYLRSCDLYQEGTTRYHKASKCFTWEGKSYHAGFAGGVDRSSRRRRADRVQVRRFRESALPLFANTHTCSNYYTKRTGRADRQPPPRSRLGPLISRTRPAEIAHFWGNYYTKTIKLPR
jgi:hypothetical protein